MAENGKLPSSALRPIAGNGQLEPAAAAAWNAMAAYIYEKTGHKIAPNGPDSSYRPYDRQVYYWNLYQSGQGNPAAYPGTSNHGVGLAVDSDDAALINEYGAEFGWQKAWSDAQNEWWHFKYRAGIYDGPNPGSDYDASDPVIEKIRKKIDEARKASGKKTKRLRGIQRQLKKIELRIKRWRARIERRKKEKK